MAHRSSTDGPNGARTSGEPTGARWGYRAQNARTLLAARGSSTCATAAAMDEVVRAVHRQGR